MTLTLDVELPDELHQLRLPAAVAARLQELLDRQDSGQPLSSAEREEAEGLVDLAEFLTLLRRRAERLISRPLMLAIRREEAVRGRHPPPPVD
ncbi:MAG: hypothetical protein SFV23_16000 [Planctomycetaceae bacterium]|nr:hypothetical protein [Planctomycetaceae bacterium]